MRSTSLVPTILQPVRDAVDRLREQGLRRYVSRRRHTLWQLLRTALACGFAWFVAADLVGNTVPVLAPLAALLTVQITVVETVSRGIQQIVGVVGGVVAAVFVAHWLGPHPWSIAVVIFVALAAGRALRLGPQANQVATSALLVLSLGAGYGTARVIDTLIGAAVGVGVNLLVAPPTLVQEAGRAIADVADDAADLLRDVGRGVTDRDPDAARGWLRRARELSPDLARARNTVEQAEESLRFNPRAWRAAAVTVRLVEAGVCLDHVVNELRALTRQLSDTPDLALPSSYADGLTAAAAALEAFARLQVEDPDARNSTRTDLADHVAAAYRARNEAADALRNRGASTGDWASMGSLLAELGRVIDELDPAEGPHRRAIPEPR